ncbi:pleckstrin homology-like domain family B member 2 isoform X1 [Brachionus plicatilis]|uniref:Pleckstrin homology-like domain family B member 2 isoform X1 n=1 Tax=Brachionus plicatilis TaxID=10195 RepID=A0A3M7RVP4_BRAPC|nr:pleckstrin homology-like domain family B member 2 isoform X1 [Brachionus plicatilis]
MVNFHNSKPELSNIDKNENFERSKNNSKRSSLRNFKSWTPFNDHSETKKSFKDEYLIATTGIVRRMANSISSQLLNKSNSTLERPKPNLLPDRRSVLLSNLDKKIDSSFQKNPSKPSINHAKNNSNLYFKETIDGINIQLQEPHLISVSFDESKNDQSSDLLSKTSIQIFPLKLGKCSVGSSEKSDLVIKGPGIQSLHCFIENSSKSKSIENLNKENTQFTNRKSFGSLFKRAKTKDASNSRVTMYPIAKLCAIDGVLIESPTALTSGNIICFGESNYFRYNHPNNENRLNSRKEEKSSEQSSDNKSKVEKASIIAIKSQKKEENTEKMLEHQETQLSESNTKGDEFNCKDCEERKLSKVRFSIPEKSSLNESNKSDENLNKESVEAIDPMELELIKYLNSSKLNAALNRKSIWIPGYGLVNFF